MDFRHNLLVGACGLAVLGGGAVYSRAVVGWSTEERMTRERLIQALTLALLQHRP